MGYEVDVVTIDDIDDLLIIEELNDLFDCEGEWQIWNFN